MDFEKCLIVLHAKRNFHGRSTPAVTFIVRVIYGQSLKLSVLHVIYACKLYFAWDKHMVGCALNAASAAGECLLCPAAPPEKITHH